MAGSDSLSQADVNRLLRMSNSQSESALKERVRQMDHSPQLDTMTHTQLQGCMFVLCCSCMYHEDNIVGFSCDFMLCLHSWKI